MPKNIRSIGIPSNRDFKSSLESIQNAATFCRKTDTELILSDNSGDVIKEKEWSGSLQGAQRYIKSPPCGGIENWTKTFNETDAEFVLMMGDDDHIFSYAPPPDFSKVPNDVVAIRTYIMGYTDTGGARKININPIVADKPHERIIENLKQSPGANLGFFCFWRRKILKSVFDLWLIHHPLKGVYCDWAMTHGLISSGKAIIDPTSFYFYNLQNWAGTPEHIANQVDGTFTKSGLPAGSGAYEHIFHGIDSYIFINRKDSPVNEKERGMAAVYCLNMYLQNYIKKIPVMSQHENAQEIARISQRLVGNDSIPDIFSIVLEILDAVQAGLGKKYQEYHKVATGKPWGIFL